jgi:hypothetical protein
VKLALVPAYFCSQECFKRYWPIHKTYHKKEGNTITIYIYIYINILYYIISRGERWEKENIQIYSKLIWF